MVELPIDERERFLAAECRGDPGLAEKVRHLLSHAESPREIFEALPEIAGEYESASPVPEVPGYTIGRRIGEGGFGVVYEAQQLQPVQRPVALKLIRFGSFSETAQARFTIECQALARLDHPSIAHVFDAGTTPAGHLFCSMELVDGTSICDFANAHRLSARERVELVFAVAEAVQHAHQRGILHRDLKPSNILVTRLADRPVPKIIDFGIAKARDDDGDEVAGLTLSGEFIGTPVYMSPEQAAGRRGEVDTRSDVYSLAVVLFELLTGTTPVEVSGSSPSGLEAVLRALREDDAPLASRRLHDAGQRGDRHAERCGTSREALLRVLRGDLDRVLAMALDKDRTRRYESAGQFGADLGRFLRNDAVLAQSPTTAYLLRKFAQRHRGKIAAAVIALLLLVAGVVGTSIGLVQAMRAEDSEAEARKLAEREEENARLEARISGEIATFLNDDLLSAVAPEGLGIDVSMQEALDAASERIEGRFPGLPAVEIAIRTTLGATYRALGLPESALPHLERARSLAGLSLGPEDPRHLRALCELGATYHALARNEEAEPIALEALERSARVLGEGHAETLAAAFHLACIHAERPDQVDARALVERWLPISRASLGPAHPQTIQFEFGLGHIYSDLGEKEAALAVFEAAFERARIELGATHRRTLMLTGEVASARFRAGDKQAAEGLLRDAWQAAVEALGERHPATLNLQMRWIGSFSRDPARRQESQALFDEMVELWPTIFRADHPMLLAFWCFVADYYLALEEDPSAEELLRKVALLEARAPPQFALEALSKLSAIAERAGDTTASQAWREKFESVRARAHSGH